VGEALPKTIPDQREDPGGVHGTRDSHCCCVVGTGSSIVAGGAEAIEDGA